MRRHETEAQTSFLWCAYIRSIAISTPAPSCATHRPSSWIGLFRWLPPSVTFPARTSLCSTFRSLSPTHRYESTVTQALYAFLLSLGPSQIGHYVSCPQTCSIRSRIWCSVPLWLTISALVACLPHTTHLRVYLLCTSPVPTLSIKRKLVAIITFLNTYCELLSLLESQLELLFKLESYLLRYSKPMLERKLSISLVKIMQVFDVIPHLSFNCWEVYTANTRWERLWLPSVPSNQVLKDLSILLGRSCLVKRRFFKSRWCSWCSNWTLNYRTEYITSKCLTVWLRLPNVRSWNRYISWMSTHPHHCSTARVWNRMSRVGSFLHWLRSQICIWTSFPIDPVQALN